MLSRRLIFRLALGIAALASMAAADWTPGVGEALGLYRRGDLAGASQVLRSAAGSNADAATARDARVIRLMIDMQADERPVQRDARAELMELGQADSDLLARPEVQQALGLAALAQFETTTAIELLRKAAEGFEQRGMNALAARSWVGVAEAWAIYGEWEITPRDWIDRRPRSPEEAQSLRIAKVMATVEHAQRLGTAGASTAEEIQLVLGRMYLAESADDANGRAILEALADSGVSVDVAARAAWELGVAAESAGQPVIARRRYEQARRSSDQALAQRASAAAARVAASPYELELKSLPGGVRATLRTDSAHPQELWLEARPVDVSAWLRSRQGRWDESAAPLGAVLTARHALPAVARSGEASPREQQVDVTLSEAGAYVLSIHEQPGAPPVARRIWMQAAPGLHVLVGSERAAVLVDGIGDEKCEGEFWIQGGFVPQRLTFLDGAAICPIAAESQVLLGRRWSCVVRCGKRIAVAQGELQPASPQFDVALRTGPDGETAAGEISVVGALVDGWGRPARDPRGATVSVELRNADGRALLSADSVLRGPFLFAPLPLQGLIAPDALHLVARHGARTLALVDGRLPVSTRLASLPLETTVEGPEMLSVGESATVRWQVRSAWDSPLTGTRTSLRYDTVALPTSDRIAPERLPTFEERVALDAAGRASWDIPVGHFRDTPPPQLGSVFLSTGGAGGLSTARWRVLQPASSAMADSDPRTSAWIHPVSAAPGVGTPLFFSAGWIDTRDEILPAAPSVVVTDPAGVETVLAVRLTGRGWRSDDFRPTTAGEYRASLRIPRMDHAPLTANCAWKAVAESAAATPSLPRIRATREPEGKVIVTVGGIQAEAGSSYWIVVGDESPSAAARLSPPDGQRSVTIELPKSAPASLAWLIVSRPSGVSKRTWGRIEDSKPSTIALNVVDPGLLSGTAILTAGTSASRAGAGLLLLTRATDPDGPQTSTVGRTSPRPPPLFRIFDAGRGDSESFVDVASEFATAAPLRGDWDEPLVFARMIDLPSARRGVQGGVQGGVHTAIDNAQIAIELPAQAGVYRARLLTQGTDGGWLTGDCLIDTRDRVELSLDFPVRCVPGDQSTATLVVTNRSNTAREVTIDLAGEGGESIGWREADGRISAAGRRTVSVPARQSRRLEAVMVVGAANAGALNAVATDGAGTVTKVSRRFLTTGAATPDAALGADITVKRSLYRISLPPSPLGGQVRPPATLEPIELDASLPEGVVLRVVDEIVAAAPLRGVRWTQPLAGNLVAFALDEAGERVQIGGQEDVGFDAYVWRTDQLPSRMVRHEYDVMTGRPGLCVLPVPTVLAGNQVKSVRMEGTVRLRVTRAPEAIGGTQTP